MNEGYFMVRIISSTIVLLFLGMCAIAEEVYFIESDSTYSSSEQLTWMSPNEYRKAISLSGDWVYRKEKDRTLYQAVIPSLCDYQGDLTFRRTFLVDSSLNHHHFNLVCYGINYLCDIFINGKPLGRHEGGYNSFTMHLPQGYLAIGDTNVIEIKTQTNLDPHTTMPLKYQFLGQKHYGGIYRDIYILALPEINVNIKQIDYHLTEQFEKAEIKLNYEIQSLRKSNDMQMSSLATGLRVLIDLQEYESRKSLLKRIVPIDQISSVKTPFEIDFEIENPQMWHPDHPFLYEITISLASEDEIFDQSDQKLGIRDVKVIGGDLYLNGQRMIFRGINWYENQEELIKNSPLATFKRDLQALKALHVNAVRAIGHPPHPYWVTLCDVNGIFLFEEIPLSWTPAESIHSPRYQKCIADYFTEAVSRDAPSVSLFSWGIGGPFDSAGVHFMRQLVGQTDRRPYYDSFGGYAPIESGLPADIATIDLFELKDRKIAGTIDQWLRSNSNRLTIVKSFGSMFREHEDKQINSSVQAVNISSVYNLIRDRSEIDGYFITSLRDWECNYPLIPFGIRQNSTVFASGLIDSTDNRRRAFETVQGMYMKAKPEVKLAIDRYEKNSPGIFTLTGIVIIFIFLYIYNSRRYIRDNIRRIFLHPHGFFVDLRDNRKVPISHTFLIALLVSIGLGLIGSIFLYFYKGNFLFDHILTLLSFTEARKYKILELSWNPGQGLLVCSVFFFFLLFISALIIKFFAIIFRKKISLGQTITLFYWIAANYLTLIPLGMILLRLFGFGSYQVPIFIFLALIHLWFFIRLIKAIKVIYYWTAITSFFFIVTIFIIVVLTLIYYYQRNAGLWDYLSLYITHLK